jgi:hypothetical protein
MPINDEAPRHFANAMIDSGRSFEFVLNVLLCYYGNLGREVAIAAFEAHEGNTADSEGVEPYQTP